MNWVCVLHDKLDDGSASKYTHDVLYCETRAEAHNLRRIYKAQHNIVPKVYRAEVWAAIRDKKD